MSDALVFGLTVLVFLFLVFLVLAFRFPEVLRRLTGAKLTFGLEGVSVDFALQAIKERESREPDVASVKRQMSALIRRVLWVDDQPDNNRNEAQALRANGLLVDQVKTNKEAVSQLRQTPYDLVVSDISRGDREPDDAGLQLRDEVARLDIEQPPFIYYVGTVTSPKTPAGDPVTARPSELFTLIAHALSGIAPV